MNPVTHFEIPFDDVERAQSFYQKTFGWQIGKIPDMNYHMATTTECDSETHIPLKPGAINGGMYKRDEHSSKHPVLVLLVSHLDEALEKVKSNGGTVFMEKVQVGTMGWYAQFKDPEGNVLGLWEIIDKKEE